MSFIQDENTMEMSKTRIVERFIEVQKERFSMKIAAHLHMTFIQKEMTSSHQTKLYWLAGGMLGLALSVVLGAFGAHSLEEKLNERNLEVFQTAITYMRMHAFGICLLTLLELNLEIQYQREKWLLFIGILIFCGSLLLISTRSILGMEGLSKLGMITPVGGLLFILSWILAAIKTIRSL
jgi:uncharacterized membrane protein YgdD (TMEM256/DUF423 family)